MTIREQLELEKKKQFDGPFETQGYHNGIKVAELICEVAIEKQTPKRHQQGECPNCKKFVPILHICDEVRDNKTTYCQYCGQALDWNN